LDHLAAGNPIDPFWFGKFSASQLPIIDELTVRGLLKEPPIAPSFLAARGAKQRLAAARAGLSPADLISQ
jgi:hypothetical protein